MNSDAEKYTSTSVDIIIQAQSFMSPALSGMSFCRNALTLVWSIARNFAIPSL